MFRRQAGGQARVYQLEIVAVVWKFPAALKCQRGDLEKSGCISCLGENGPWTVERRIGMHEIPNEMDTDGKASMVEAAVRNTAVQLGGEVDRGLAPAHVAEHESVDKRRSGPRCWSCIGGRPLVQQCGVQCLGRIAFLSAAPGECDEARWRSRSGRPPASYGPRPLSPCRFCDNLGRLPRAIWRCTGRWWLVICEACRLGAAAFPEPCETICARVSPMGCDLGCCRCRGCWQQRAAPTACSA